MVALSFVLQRAMLRQDYPFGKTTGNQNFVRWQGEICPSEVSDSYVVEMLYKRGYSPAVWVRSPNLKKICEGRSLPHVYDQESQRLCLFLPGCGFWTPEKLVSRTIMIWATLWLRYFEIWCFTDVFAGTGVHPRITAKMRKQLERIEET